MAPREVFLAAYKGRESALYTVEGRRTEGDGIDATFPGLGRVSIGFRPRGRPHRVRLDSHCKGRRELIQRGVFRGEIRFRGEDGFTEVKVHRAEGAVVQSFRKVCTYRRDTPSRQPHDTSRTTTLRAEREFGAGYLTLYASRESSRKNPEHGFASLQVILSARRGSMEETRSVFLGHLDASAFLTDPADSLSSATISPPAPFTGTGTFQWSRGSTPAWTGDLSVELPGAGQVALAGPEFSTELCIESRCTETAIENP